MTTRPPFQPFPTTPEHVIELDVAAATRTLAEELRADTIPVTIVEPRDGWLSTQWFRSADGAPIDGRPLGEDAVLVRAWIGPRRAGECRVRVEAVWRPWADPSLSDRQLERPLPTGHPVAVRVERVVTRLLSRYAPPEEAPGAAGASRPPTPSTPD
jgi:hypothetical protein